MLLELDTNKDEGQGRAVKIVDPLPWHEPVSGDRLAETLAVVVKQYLVLSDAAADVIALWVMHTWCVNAFTMSPRLAITSPTKGCGKTTVLRLLNHIARRAKRAGSISPSALFRTIEQFQPTILLDETEKYIEHGSDLHALLNEGHCKGGSVLRVLGEKLELREFSVFGAMAFARNGRLPDDLEQRSIVIEMQRRRADEDLAELRDDRSEQLQQIAKMCVRWADDYAGSVTDCDPEMEMINRNRDNWRPLFAIADMCGEDWPDRIREAAANLAPRESETFGIMLLADIKMLFEEKRTPTDWHLFRNMCGTCRYGGQAVGGMESQQGGITEADHEKPVGPNVEAFHIVSDTVRIDVTSQRDTTDTSSKGPSRAILTPRGFPKRYNATSLLPQALPPPFETSDASDVAFQKCEKPLGDSDCSGVAFQKGDKATNGIDEPDPDGWSFNLDDEDGGEDLSIPKFLRR